MRGKEKIEQKKNNIRSLGEGILFFFILQIQCRLMLFANALALLHNGAAHNGVRAESVAQTVN
jgi:hypothetical protein